MVLLTELLKRLECPILHCKNTRFICTLLSYARWSGEDHQPVVSSLREQHQTTRNTILPPQMQTHDLHSHELDIRS